MLGARWSEYITFKHLRQLNKIVSMEPNIPGVSSTSRATRFMMEGIGARVIRGPDWKWGKQVTHCLFLLKLSFFSYFLHRQLLDEKNLPRNLLSTRKCIKK